jgi:predicted chitinase
LAALIFWIDKDLNSLCVPDNQKVTIKRLNSSGWYNYTCSPIEAITRKINGGVNGFEDRIKNYELLKKYI